MDDKYFIDTNLLVYAHDVKNPKKMGIAQQLIFEGIRNDSGTISTQVLSEFFVTVTKKLERSIGINEAKLEIELLRSLTVVEIEYEMVIRAINIHKEYKVSYWDALIIVAALRSQCTKLYTEDLNPGQTFEGLEIVNPLI